MRTFDDLLALMEGFPWRPAKPRQTPADSASTGSPDPTDSLAHDRAIVESVGLFVIGELADGSVKIFCRFDGKTRVIRRVDQLTYTDFLQICGPPARENLVQSADVEALAPGQHTVKSLKHSIAMLAGRERAGEGYERGQGVWQGKCDCCTNGKPCDCEAFPLVLVNPGRAGLFVNPTLTVQRAPLIAGLKVDLDYPAEGTWFDSAILAEDLESAGDRPWVDETINRARDLFGRWYWRTSELVVPDVCVGLALATWVQSCWRWRPHVAITGPSDSGKSTLFELLETLFGPLAILSSKSTAAGIRQTVAHHSKVILCDEFESDKHRREILELFRTSSKGAKTLRGTTAQLAREYGLRHICWVTAIEIGLQRAPDRNRYIWLELEAPPSAVRGKLALPSEPELARLGQRLLALAVRHVAAGVRLADHLKGIAVEGVHGRVVESYAVPVGMLAAVDGMDERLAEDLLRSIFDKLEKDPSQSTKDETDLVGDILSSRVKIERGEEAGVGQILAGGTHRPGGWDALERAGIVPVAKSPAPGERQRAYEQEEARAGIFVATKQVQRFLLKGTQWADQNVDQLLKRLPGAVKCQRAIGGHRPYGVVIPWEYLKDRFLDREEETF